MRGVFKKILIAFLHAVWMLFLVFMWLKLPFASGSELEATSSFRYYQDIFSTKKNKLLEHYNETFLFFNVSRDQQLDTVYSEHESNIITNRETLSKVLTNLEKDTAQYSLVILDIFVDEIVSPADTVIANSVERLKKMGKIVTVSFVDKADDIGTELSTNAFGDTLSGISYYGFGPKESFYKQSFQFWIGDNYYKQLALIADEQLRGYHARKPFLFDLFYNCDNKKGLYRNLIVPKLAIKNDMIKFPAFDEDSTINAYDIQDMADTSLLSTIWYNKEKPVIIIGDMLLSDKHFTSEGMMSGPLIVINTLAELQCDSNRMTFLHFIFLLLSFTLISLVALFGKSRIEQLKYGTKNKYTKIFYSLLFKDTHYLLLFVVTMLDLVFFQHYIFIIFFAVYFLVLEKILFLFKKRKPTTL